MKVHREFDLLLISLRKSYISFYEYQAKRLFLRESLLVLAQERRVFREKIEKRYRKYGMYSPLRNVLRGTF